MPQPKQQPDRPEATEPTAGQQSAQPTQEPPVVSQQEAEQQAEEDRTLSRDARFSTYRENTDLPEQNPPPGRHVIQEPGEPSEDA